LSPETFFHQEGRARVVFKIAQFARLAGVSPKVLRAYDALRLFRPVWVDPDSGYRFYSPAQLPELRRILALRDLGMPLAEIGRLQSDGSDLARALERRRAELERERREVERRLAALEISVGMHATEASPVDVVVRPLAEELVATFRPSVVGGDMEAAFYELESFVRDRGRRAHRPPGALIAGARPDGQSSSGEDEIFVPITGPLAPTDRVGVRRLPGCRAATVIVRGAYDALPESRAALERWVGAAGLAVAGPLRIIYLQFGAEPELRLPAGYVVGRSADFVTELQRPVT
jgi:DNA-binding transcriptional MerR regulator